MFYNLNTDLKYLIFKTNVVDLEKRLSIELDLIHLFLNLKLNLLNEKIANQKYIKKIFFFLITYN